MQWEIQKDSVVIELYGRIGEDDYMAFGLSGANGRSQMVNSKTSLNVDNEKLHNLQINGDVVVAFYDRKKLRFRVEDYHLSALSQCDGKQGACPDERVGGKNDAVFSKKMSQV